jgi:hypothetical protein
MNDPDSDVDMREEKEKNHSSVDSNESQKEPLSDVWIFDTFKCTWLKLEPNL